MKTVARIFQEVTGKYHICDNNLSYLDARGYGYNSRREAIRSIRESSKYYDNTWTHYVSGNRIRKI